MTLLRFPYCSSCRAVRRPLAANSSLCAVCGKPFAADADREREADRREGEAIGRFFAKVLGKDITESEDER